MFWHIFIKQFVRKSKDDIVQVTLFKNSRRYTIMSTCPPALPSLIDFFTTVYSASVNGPSTIPIPHKIGDIASSSPSMVCSFPRSSLKWIYHLLILSSLSLAFMMPFLAVLPVISLNKLQLSLCLNSSSAVSTCLIILSRSFIVVLYCSCNLLLCLSTSLLFSVGLQ